MKKELLLFTVILSNITFASMPLVEVPELKALSQAKNQLNTLENSAKQYLLNKGMDRDIAQIKVQNTLAGNEHSNMLISQKLVENFETITHQTIASYFGSKALLDKRVNLNEYDELIGFVQRSGQLNIDATTREKIENILEEVIA